MGLRSKELLKAKWADIDWDMGTLFVGLIKNGEPLLAPISDAAMDRLRAIPRISGNPNIICGRLPGQYLRSLGDPPRRVLKRAGLVNLRIHDLRRTVGSWLAQDGQRTTVIRRPRPAMPTFRSAAWGPITTSATLFHVRMSQRQPRTYVAVLQSQPPFAEADRRRTPRAGRAAPVWDDPIRQRGDAARRDRAATLRREPRELP
jgi:hypothetical protein